MSVREIVVCADQRSLAYAAAQFVLGEIERKESHPFLLALSGGSTPAAMYDLLAQNRAAGHLINSKCEIFFSDERLVSPDHPDSNFRLAQQRLFDPLGIEPGIIHRMHGESDDATAEARCYADSIRVKAGGNMAGTPRFDLILLGMGADGHTASLFTDYNFDLPEQDIVVAPWVARLGTRRLSFAMKLLNASHAALILVSGAQKAAAVKSALDSSILDSRLPAARVAAERTVWMLDQEAARELNWTGRVLSL